MGTLQIALQDVQCEHLENAVEAKGMIQDCKKPAFHSAILT